jgi:hypothetical protein
MRTAAPGLLALLALLAGCHMDAEFEAPEGLEPLDPGRYEAAITAVDREIFTSGTLDGSRRQALSGALTALAAQVDTPATSRFARYCAGELRTLARLVERLKPRTPIEDSPLQDQWMRIRNNLFDDASWFARSEADLHRPPPGENPMLVPAPVVAQLRGVLDELAGMARELPEELGRLRVEDAPYWQQSWQARLSMIAPRMPAEPPFPANPFLLSALRNGKEGLRMIGRLPDAHRPWEGRERASWTEHYEHAARLIDNAREDLSKVQVRAEAQAVTN